jgi:hypothetical protein
MAKKSAFANLFVENPETAPETEKTRKPRNVRKGCDTANLLEYAVSYEMALRQGGDLPENDEVTVNTVTDRQGAFREYKTHEIKTVTLESGDVSLQIWAHKASRGKVESVLVFEAQTENWGIVIK